MGVRAVGALVRVLYRWAQGPARSVPVRVLSWGLAPGVRFDLCVA
jgi:hypothetical protein